MKKIFIFIILGILLLSIVGSVFVSAQELIPNPPETTTNSEFSFYSWFTNTFGIEKFSIVGDSRRCSSNPDYSVIVTKGVHYSHYASEFCPSGYGLWDVFSPDWNPYKEFNNNVDITCGASGSCNVQLYCCSHSECSSDSDCQNWVGEFSTCKTASCISWNGGYKCTTDYGTETNIPYCRSSFKYCSQSISKNCYYVNGNSCTKHTYPGVSVCPDSYQGSKIYSSLSACEDNVCSPQTCSSLGKQCGTWSDGCGTNLNCGSCSSGTSCNSNGYCQTQNTTSPLCTGAISCESSLIGCSGPCPSGYVAGTTDSCGFHNCIPSSASNQTQTQNIPSETSTQNQEKIFDINSIAFKVGEFNVSWLYLIIGMFLLIILIGLIPKK